MNYIKQASKDDPFEGLSLGDQKKMVVYFHHHANPKMNDEEIFKRYGFVLPWESQMYLGEELQLSLQVAVELTKDDSSKNSNGKKCIREETSSETGCLIPLVVVLSMLLGCTAAVAKIIF